MAESKKPAFDPTLTQQIRTVKHERDIYLTRLKQLNSIGIALTTERNPKKLFTLILQKAREITSADAGSLFLVEENDEGKKVLRFKILQNDSMETTQYEETVIPMSRGSIVGWTAVTGLPLHIPDAYKIKPDSEYGFNRTYDETTGYRTVSVLAIPMRSHKGEVIGGMQLINRKCDFKTKLTPENCNHEVIPFDKDDEELAGSLASQAAVALENISLIRSIETLFEGFVTAAVSAIESRDPTTSGHSFRVADLTVGLAELVDKLDAGPFGGVRFTSDEIKEIRYAALLHDFGKVGVREHVLIKAKKLYPHQLDLLKERFRFFRKAWETEYYKSKLNSVLEKDSGYERRLEELDIAHKNRLESIDKYFAYIMEINEPLVLASDSEHRLDLSMGKDLIPPGMDTPFLTPEELDLLSIQVGSLNESERTEIESHVIHTYSFLSKIPWTNELKQVPQIAYGHHEKLNGTGYPNKFVARDIPVQTRMMTISDIYDALTASDRPYKRAVPSEKALDILASEVKKQKVDADLFQLFLEGKIYNLTMPK